PRAPATGDPPRAGARAGGAVRIRLRRGQHLRPLRRGQLPRGSGSPHPRRRPAAARAGTRGGGSEAEAARPGEPNAKGTLMKVGMNMLLWTTNVGREHYPILRQLKEVGYDGVEIPIFKRDDAAFGELKRALDDVGLEATAVTVAAPEANPIDP